MECKGEGGEGTYYHLNILTNNGDINAFLHTFETTAMAAHWPWPQWVTILPLPYGSCTGSS